MYYRPASLCHEHNLPIAVAVTTCQVHVSQQHYWRRLWCWDCVAAVYLASVNLDILSGRRTAGREFTWSAILGVCQVHNITRAPYDVSAVVRNLISHSPPQFVLQKMSWRHCLKNRPMANFSVLFLWLLCLTCFITLLQHVWGQSAPCCLVNVNVKQFRIFVCVKKWPNIRILVRSSKCSISASLVNSSSKLCAAEAK